MDETVPNVADASAPELEATAAIEPVENTTPETPAEQEANKSFTQEELDAINALPDDQKRLRLTELGLDAFNNETGAEIMEASNAPLTFGYPDMVQLEFILYKKGTGDLTVGEDKYTDTITMLFQSEYCMIENVGLDYGAQNKMVFLSSPESAEAGDYFPSEVNMTIALKESVLITAAYATAEHETAGRTIF